MKQMKQRKCNKGFTLIELIVVVVVVGILSAVFAPTVLGSKDGADSMKLLRMSQSATNNWMMIAQACGTTSDTASSPVPAAGKTVADVLFGGSSNVAAAYQTCYGQSHVLPLTELGQPKSGGGWNVSGYTTTFAGGGTAPMQTVIATVPDSLVLTMAQKYTPTLSSLAASDTTSSVVQYSTATAGTRTVTLLRQVM